MIFVYKNIFISIYSTQMLDVAYANITYPPQNYMWAGILAGMRDVNLKKYILIGWTT
jgi:hypothetical protein